MQENRREKSPIKERILQYLEYKGITKYVLYKKSGISRGILDQDTGISEDNLRKFLKFAQDISPTWLVVGEGAMLKTKSTEIVNVLNVTENVNENVNKPKVQNLLTTEPEQIVPVYEAPSLLSLEPLFSGQIAPTGYISLPNLPKCDGAVRMWGDRMDPEIKSGDLLAYRRVKDLRNGLFLGQVYLISLEIDGEEYVFVQYLEESDISDHVKLVSNNDRYPPKDIPLSSIRSLAMIKASVRYRAV